MKQLSSVQVSLETPFKKKYCHDIEHACMRLYVESSEEHDVPHTVLIYVIIPATQLKLLEICEKTIRKLMKMFEGFSFEMKG